MGVVKRQGIKQSMVTYFGVVIGVVNTLLIFPALLDQSQIGLINFVRETAIMFSLFAFLGSAELIVRYFPHFKDEKNGNNGFLFLLLAILTAGCLLFTIVWLLFKEQIYVFFGLKTESALYLQFLYLILPFTIVIAYGNLFTFYVSNFQRIVVPALFNELLPKLGMPLLVVAFYLKWIAFEAILYGSLVIYIAILIGQAWYVHHLGQLRLRPNFKALRKSLVKEMAQFSMFGFLGSLGSRLSSEFLNFFMLGTISTLANTGIYAIAYAIANVVDVPRKAISRIVSPLLADKFKEGKLAEVEDIYHKTAINQLIVGLLVFLAVWVSIGQIYEIMPNGEKFQAGKQVVLLLGIARIVDMMTGANSEILSYSKHYRFNFYLVLFMAVVHVGANIYFIKTYGLIGVGIATLITLTLYNLAKLTVLKWKLNMQPFSKETVFVLGAAGAAFLASNYLPSTHFALLDAVIRGGIFSTVFLGLVLWWNVSPDLNQLSKKTFVMIGKYKKFG